MRLTRSSKRFAARELIEALVGPGASSRSGNENSVTPEEPDMRVEDEMDRNEVSQAIDAQRLSLTDVPKQLSDDEWDSRHCVTKGLCGISRHT